MLALPLAIVFRLLYPIIKIRFGYFYADRIGHFAFDVEHYLVTIDRAENKSLAYDIFFLKGRICNQELAKLTAQRLRIIPWSWPIYRAASLLPNNPVVLDPARKLTGSRDPQGLFIQTRPRLFSREWVSSSTIDENLKPLTRYGVNNQTSIVCLIVRDSAYLKSTDLSRDWNYHSYRDTPISLYEPVARHLAEKGYFVFRMGREVNQRMQSDHPRIIDYANAEWRSEFLDLWLIANSKFCISTSTGIDSVADICRKPLALVNFLPISYFQTWSNCVLAPCNLEWKSTGEALTFREQLLFSFQRSEDYERYDIVIKPLDEKQVSRVVLETEQRATGKWQVSEDELQQQSVFKQILCVPDDQLIAQLPSGMLEDRLGLLSRRSRPAERVGKFHSQAFLSQAFLGEFPNFLNYGSP
jgi:putative glycosyltransferase (TIGR04372 family)